MKAPLARRSLGLGIARGKNSCDGLVGSFQLFAQPDREISVNQDTYIRPETNEFYQILVVEYRGLYGGQSTRRC